MCTEDKNSVFYWKNEAAHPIFPVITGSSNSSNKRAELGEKKAFWRDFGENSGENGHENPYLRHARRTRRQP